MLRQVFMSGVAAVLLVPLAVQPAAGSPRAPERSSDWAYTLQSVNADAPDDVWAVGWRADGRIRRTFIEHWDGESWTTVPSPNRSPHNDDVLTGVSAISRTDAWAVGFYGSPSGYRALTLHWNGVRWRHVPSPSGHHYSVLEDVSAVAPDDIWAVGAITKNEGYWYRALIEHWDGRSWSIVDSTPPRRRVGGLGAVDAVSADDVWAGAGDGSTQFGAGALFHYDGRWAEHDGPLDGTVMSLSMDSASDGWAVGGGMTKHWDGQSWQSVSNPIGALEVVAAYSPTDAWEIGDGLGHWDGVSWTRMEQTVPGDFFGMDMLAPDDVWAVGTVFGVGDAAIMHWDGTRWSAPQ